MAYLLFLTALILSLIFIGKAAQVAIRHLSIIAHQLSWSTFVISFLILGLATSIPEFLIGINSAIDKTPQLSLGNLVGATVVLLTLVIGLTAFITGKVQIDTNFTHKDLYLTNFVLLLPLTLFHDNYFSRIDALIVLIVYIGYLIKVYSDRHKLAGPNEELVLNGKVFKHIGYFFLAFFVVVGSSKVAVESAIFLAEGLKIPLLLLGVLIFSVGTNFPELAIAITAIRNKDTSLIGGNILGSTTTNSLIIAMLGLIRPFRITEPDLFLVSIFFFTVSVLTFSYFVKSKSEISRLEGLLLLSIYSFFLIFEVITKLI